VGELDLLQRDRAEAPVGEALSGAAANAIGLAIRRPARVLGVEPFFMELVSGMEAVLSAAGSALMLQVVGDANVELALYRRWWAAQRIDGAIVVDLRADDPRVSLLEELARWASRCPGTCPSWRGTTPRSARLFAPRSPR
jgi:DNA-binding LacI/PurR family transcriptional regulator